MNDWDRNNLEFILSLKTQAEWEAWAENLDKEDMIYALNLVKTAQAEVDVRNMELDEEDQDDEGLDCTEALEIINRVKKEIL